MQALRNSEGSIHSNHAAIEVQLWHAFKAACGTFLDADTAALAVVDQNLIEAVRTRGAHDARLGTHEIAVVAGIAGTATETAAGFLDRLLFRVGENHFVLRFAPAHRPDHGVLDARDVGYIRHGPAMTSCDRDDVDG